jgi:cell fate (sporulation/competence/biofilm development) regulator YlbF (YheA/YmcA/DUF963 family)
MDDLAPLKAKIEAVKKDNGEIKTEFEQFAQQDISPDDSKWAVFASKVDAAYTKLNAAIKSLEEYNSLKASTSKAVTEDPDAKIFEEYTNLYNRITTALMNDGHLKPELTSNYDDLLTGIKGDNLNSSIYIFIEAIKSNSLNSRAKEIKNFEGNGSDINYQLLKSVLKILDLKNIKKVGLRNLSSLDQLLDKLVEMLNDHKSYFSQQISGKYTDSFAAPQDGGSSSSSKSKKKRKSHKSYHPDIGKTKKHHHRHHKKISFVH